MSDDVLVACVCGCVGVWCVPQAYRYLSSIAVKEGKVFALFVRSPSKVGGAKGYGIGHRPAVYPWQLQVACFACTK